MRRSIALLLTMAGIMTWSADSALAAAGLQGYMRSDGVTGRPAATPQGWDDKDDTYPLGTPPKIYLGQLDVGQGAAGMPFHNPHGWYNIPKAPPPTFFPAGTYALFTLGFNTAPSFSYRTDVVLPPGTDIPTNVNLHTPAHYSVMYNAHYNEWGSAPWIWGSDFYQTFVATTPHITRLATRLAGKDGSYLSMTLNFGIYAVNDGPPSTWTQISPTRSLFLDSNMDPIIHLLWVPYRSSEMTLIPGQTYAARFWRAPGSQSSSFAIVARPDSNNGYASGHLYSGNSALASLDAYGFISGGQSGTIVNHAPVPNIQAGSVASWATRFGQTFQASGTSVAAAEIIYVTGDPTPPVLGINFQVYTAPGGAPIGPAKTGYGLQGFYEARAAAFWREGEVPTTPGQTYYIEWMPPPSGCNTFYMNGNVPGGAYINGVSQGATDLLMTIAEYLPPSAKIELTPPALNPSVEVGGSPPPDVFNVRNVGGEPLNYTISEQVPWLSVAPASGTVGGGAMEPVTVTYTTASFGIGTYVGQITVEDPDASNSPQTLMVTLTVRPHPGDFDLDGDVDQEDFAHLQACYTGPGFDITDPACANADLDGDGDVDQLDFNIFYACYSGPNNPAQHGCGD